MKNLVVLILALLSSQSFAITADEAASNTANSPQSKNSLKDYNKSLQEAKKLERLLNSQIVTGSKNGGFEIVLFSSRAKDCNLVCVLEIQDYYKKQGYETDLTQTKYDNWKNLSVSWLTIALKKNPKIL